MQSLTACSICSRFTRHQTLVYESPDWRIGILHSVRASYHPSITSGIPVIPAPTTATLAQFISTSGSSPRFFNIPLKKSWVTGQYSKIWLIQAEHTYVKSMLIPLSARVRNIFTSMPFLSSSWLYIDFYLGYIWGIGNSGAISRSW